MHRTARQFEQFEKRRYGGRIFWNQGVDFMRLRRDEPVVAAWSSYAIAAAL
jgi:hypothetical protein